MTNPDTSGMLRFLTDELQDAEDAGDRVWIMGHVLTGWDGTNPLQNPTNLCERPFFYTRTANPVYIYTARVSSCSLSDVRARATMHRLGHGLTGIGIADSVDRFSPHVIANIFFGHTHEDQMSIFYANNATALSADTAHALAWMGPSVTPGTNLNSGFRVYEVDSATFEVLDAHTWRSDVSTFPGLDAQLQIGPTYGYEYNTRETYGGNITGWGPNDPLNATWWHLVTEAMEANPSLVSVSSCSLALHC
ncbi:hypothetical protein HGRIS_008363 [Hohenbuehelia grisea]|uniref:Uncharacterized protein n=1 Tax=Hohenbuehelia grisea TaxID=104357 RepID=A0ABR3J969_9AGAR